MATNGRSGGRSALARATAALADLRAERERLIARVAEIDAVLGQRAARRAPQPYGMVSDAIRFVVAATPGARAADVVDAVMARLPDGASRESVRVSLYSHEQRGLIRAEGAGRQRRFYPVALPAVAS